VGLRILIGEERPKRQLKRALLRIIGLVVFALILYKVNIFKTLPVLKDVNLSLLAISILLAVPMMSLKILRWSSVLAIQDIDLPLKNAFSPYMGSYYIGLVTPGRLGDFAKVLYLRKAMDVPYGKALVSTLMDRLLDVVLIVVVGIAGICAFGLFNRFGYASFALLALIVALFASLFSRRLLDRILRLLYRVSAKKYRDRVQLHFEDFAAGMNKLKNRKILIPVLLTVAAYALTFTQCYLIALALGIDMSFSYVAFTVSMGGLVALIPISFAGIGTRDAVIIFLFGLAGVGSEIALSFSLLYLMVFALAIGLWGAVHWFRNPVEL
jgi:uncharacterized protein (TIRG00374 family)